MVSTVHSVVRCLTNKDEVISNLAQSLGLLMTSTIAAQRAVAAAFYAELIGKVNHDSIWLDVIINTLHEARSDSSPLVRKLALIGLTRIVYLEAKQVSCIIEKVFSFNSLILIVTSGLLILYPFRSMNTLIIQWLLY